jgi:uncharacterized protein YabN with tetrapyrrole methylase and pyrophosphatase domain
MDVPIVKRYIYAAEWYPVYELHRNEEDTYGTAVQIPEDLVHRYAKAYAEFKNVQIILRSLYEEKD